MADDMNDLIKKRLAARAASKLVVDLPAPSLKGRFGLSAIDPDAYVRDHGDRTMPAHMPPLELSAQEVADDVTEGYRNRDYAQDDRDIAIREHMEGLNEAPEGGLAKLAQLHEQAMTTGENSERFTSQDGTTYYIEPEGNFLFFQSKGGDLEAVDLKTIGSMLTTQAAQMKAAGATEFPQAAAPVAKPGLSEGQRQSQANIAMLNRRIAERSDARTYEMLHKVQSESLDKYVAAAAIGKGEMVRAIATYGREEGKNMVRELREHGGEIEQHALTYKVEGETFSRTHPDKTTFDYKADEIELAVDVRQKELGAIDVWESKSPALDLQSRLAAEFEQRKGQEFSAADMAEEIIGAGYYDAKELRDDIEASSEESREINGAVYTVDHGMLSREQDGETTKLDFQTVQREAESINYDEYVSEMVINAPEFVPGTREYAEEHGLFDEARAERAAKWEAGKPVREAADEIASIYADGKAFIDDLREAEGQEVSIDDAVYKLDGDQVSRTMDGETVSMKLEEVSARVDQVVKQQAYEADFAPPTRDDDHQIDAEEDLRQERLREQEEAEQAEAMSKEEWQEKSEQYAADLMVDQQGLKLDASRSEDGPELRDEPETVLTGADKAFADYEREKLAERQQAIDQLRDEPEGTVADGVHSEYLLKGDQLYERIHHAESEGWAIWDANDPLRELNSSDRMESEMMAAFGHPEAANYVASQDLPEPPTIEEADLDVSFAEDREPSIDRPEVSYEPGEDYEFSALANVAMVEDQNLEEAALEQPDQLSEVEALKAKVAELQEQNAALQQPQEQAQSAVSSTPVEKADERQQSAEQQLAPAKEMQLGAEQGKREVTDKEVIDQVEGRTKGNDWSTVPSERYAKREAAGEKVKDKPHVARARETEKDAISKSMQQQRQQSPSQSLE
ncbi:hypothetical protein HFO61_30570 [Rhizobium leguminosarum]|uniref:hypothetical protein n=1 Tax=Rhizobium leguminosarum TaxID=384 RepID=UPI001C9477D2|nr:hypothetical protein [Rhizobium leguminosarum]MBY5551091.1 hypothetical protein [Rhizobium leguminosarum]